MTILGIETSCDETATAIIEENGKRINVLSNIVSSQINIHKKYGGVVPEVAAREHVLAILPVINEALNIANMNFKQAPKKINYLAVTTGPGLITSLTVGVETTKALSYVWQMPICSINHIEGHIYANFINQQPKIIFPAVILTVSGGHTMLVLMTNHGEYKTIGETRDDAAGEAFDKAAKLLGLGYPGGPAIAAEAAATKITNKSGNSNSNSLTGEQISLPRPMIRVKSYDFSFSGLKTALLYELQKDKNWQKKIPEYAAEFQQAIIDVLIYKTIMAAKNFKVRTVMLTGGVSANQELRKQMIETFKARVPEVKFLIPDLKYTTDNAAMVAVAGYFHALRKNFTPWQKLKADCNLEL